MSLSFDVLLYTTQVAEIDITKSTSCNATVKNFEQVDYADDEANPKMLGSVDPWPEDVEAGANMKIEDTKCKVQIKLRKTGQQQLCNVKVLDVKRTSNFEVAGAKERLKNKVVDVEDTGKVQISSPPELSHPFFLMSIVEEQTQQGSTAGVNKQAMTANQACKPRPKQVSRSGLKKFLFDKNGNAAHTWKKHTPFHHVLILSTIQNNFEITASGRGKLFWHSLLWSEWAKLITPKAMDDECCVCMDARKEFVFGPCGHLCVCEVCARDVMTTQKECPLCRTPTETSFRVFLK